METAEETGERSAAATASGAGTTTPSAAASVAATTVERLRATLRLVRASLRTAQFARYNQLLSTLTARQMGYSDRDLTIARAYLVEHGYCDTHYSAEAGGSRGTFCIAGWTLERVASILASKISALGNSSTDGTHPERRPVLALARPVLALALCSPFPPPFPALCSPFPPPFPALCSPLPALCSPFPALP